MPQITEEIMQASEIKKYRELSGMTTAELAVKLMVSENTVYRWERGDRQPAALYLDRMKKIFGRKLTMAIQ